MKSTITLFILVSLFIGCGDRLVSSNEDSGPQDFKTSDGSIPLSDVTFPTDVLSGCYNKDDCPNSLLTGEVFCYFESGCGTFPGGRIKPGECKERPTACPDLWSPVCGCDYNTYANECDAHAMGINIAYTGECGHSEPGECGILSSEYAIALQEARTCSPWVNMPQCMLRVADSLVCPCDTFVENTNANAIFTMANLKTRWDQNKCGATMGVCAPCPSPPVGAACNPVSGSSNGGICQDYWGD